MKIWTCKIGWASDDELPSSADLPMRLAVEDAFYKLTGREADFNFSGWGGELTEPQLAVVENRMPVSAAAGAEEA